MEVIEGVVMAVDEFRNAYTGDPLTRVSVQSIQNATIILENIVVREDNVKFTCIIETAGRKIKIPVSGKLASGYKTEAGINSLIVEVKDSGKEFEFLLFEVYNDKGDNNLLIGKNSMKYQNQPHTKIYLKDSNSMIYLFEGQIPVALSSYQAQNFQSADAMKDMYWFASVGKAEYQELKATQELMNKLDMKPLSRAANEVITWTWPSIFYYSTYVGQDHMQCWSLPYIEYRYTNLTNADHTWFAAFKISEHTSVSGFVYHGDYNVFRYHNLRLSFGGGSGTIFTKSFQEGRLMKCSSHSLIQAGGSIAITLFKKFVPNGSTYVEILNGLYSLATSTNTVYLGNNSITLLGNTTATGQRLDNYYLLKHTDDTGHYYIYQVNATSNLTSGSIQTKGALLFSCNVRNIFTDTIQEIAQGFELNYSVSSGNSGGGSGGNTGSAIYGPDGVDYSPVYNMNYYLQNNPDVYNAYGNNSTAVFNHFYNHGMSEARRANKEFYVVAYRNRYPDLQAAFGDNWKQYYIHWITNGRFENRIGN